MTKLIGYVRATALAATAALTLAGCGGVRYPQQYVLHFAPPALPPARPARPLGPLAVRELDCLPYLCDGRLVYREGPHRIGFYEYDRWAVDPRAALTRLVAERLRATALFDSVVVGGSPARAAYQLRGEIERFEEVDQGSEVLALCAISVQIVDIKTGNALWSGTASEGVPVRQRDVAGVVAGLSTASERVADRLVASVVNETSAKRLP